MIWNQNWRHARADMIANLNPEFWVTFIVVCGIVALVLVDGEVL